MKRVTVIGSECTGKTMLAAALARHFRTDWVAEYARAYAAERPGPLTVEDVEPIARGQLALDAEASASAERLLVRDTDLVSTVVYAEHYYGECPAWIDAAARAHASDLYLFTDIDVPWMADAQRDRPHLRPHMHALFDAALRRFELPRVDVRGDWVTRTREATEAVARLLERDEERFEDARAPRRVGRAPSR